MDFRQIGRCGISSLSLPGDVANLRGGMTEREQWVRLETVFQAALDCQPSARRAFVEKTCEAEPQLCAKVLSMLASHEAAPSSSSDQVDGVGSYRQSPVRVKAAQ